MSGQVIVTANTHVTDSHPNDVVDITADTHRHKVVASPKVGLAHTRRTSDQLIDRVMEISTVLSHTQEFA